MRRTDAAPTSPRPLERRLGIMQGRLVPSATGALDCPPGPRWREELAIAGSLELHHVEVVADRVPDPRNPIWSTAGRGEMVAAADAADVRLASLCVNEPLATPLDDPDGARQLAQRLGPVVDELGAGVVVLPLLEASDLEVLDRSGAAASVRAVADELADRGARVALELGAPAAESLRFVDAVGATTVGLCYDVGNATVLGFDPAAEVRTLGPRLWHFHAKDKNAAGENVRFGTGAVQFAPVLAALADQHFDGLVTMEATRGDDPVVTAAEHRSFLLSM